MREIVGEGEKTIGEEGKVRVPAWCCSGALRLAVAGWSEHSRSARAPALDREAAEGGDGLVDREVAGLVDGCERTGWVELDRGIGWIWIGQDGGWLVRR